MAAVVAINALNAQNYNVREDILADRIRLNGSDGLASTKYHKLTPAPKGYKEFYVSHYGRHGARYAWQHDMYERMKAFLDRADSLGALTAEGKEFKRNFDILYPQVRYTVGELSAKGWRQQHDLALLMYKDYPLAFRDGSKVTACSSPVLRCVMSMSAFCIGLKEANPSLDIYESSSALDMPRVLPLNSNNPYPPKDYKVFECPLPESEADFTRRKVDIDTILGRLLTDVDLVVPEDMKLSTVNYLYYFINGMPSLDTPLDFTAPFTVEDRLQMWESDNYQYYMYAWMGRYAYLSMLRDIVDRANEHIHSGDRGADLRFGHDTSITPLMMLMNIDGCGEKVTDPDDVCHWIQNYRIPMGTNVHIVLYRSGKVGAPILFKVTLNGDEVHLHDLQTDSWPYYKWSDFESYVSSLEAM